MLTEISQTEYMTVSTFEKEILTFIRSVVHIANVQNVAIRCCFVTFCKYNSKEMNKEF